jgi:magnesium transporter
MLEDNALLPFVRRQFEHDTATAARNLEMMPEPEAAEVLRSLPPDLAVQALRHLQVSYAAALLKDAEPELFKRIAAELDSNYTATILMHLPDDVRKRFLAGLPKRMKAQIKDVLSYPEDSVGRLMTTQFLSFNMELKAKEAIQKIRMLGRERYPASYAYVVDRSNRLVGVINMRDLMLADPDQTLAAVMRTDVYALHCFMDREEAANDLSKRRYFAAPVVDNENKILGIIKVEQLIQGVQEEVTEDMQKMFGAGGDERVFSPISFCLRKRLPWLHVNLITAFMAAFVVSLFQGVIARITILAVFLPVVAGQGGNAGAQSLAIVMRGLVMREIPADRVWKLIFKESSLGALNGIIIGAVTACVAWLWHGNPYLGLVVGLGMLVNLIFAGLAGASIPIAMKSLGLDPAQCSNIILTTVTDVVGFLSFLGFAVIFQNFLV